MKNCRLLFPSRYLLLLAIFLTGFIPFSVAQTTDSFRIIEFSKPKATEAVAQVVDEYTLLVQTTDAFTSRVIPAVVSVIPENSPTEIAGQRVQGQYVFKVKAGRKYLLVAALHGFQTYRKELSLDVVNTTNERVQNLSVSLDPEPVTTLVLRAKDKVSNQPVNATFAIFFAGKNETVTGEAVRGEYRLVIDQEDRLEIEATADGYETVRKVQNVKLGKKITLLLVDLLFTKARATELLVRVIDQADRKPLANAKVIITDLTTNRDVYAAVAPRGEAKIATDEGHNYRVQVSAQDYLFYEYFTKDKSLPDQVTIELVRKNKSFVNLKTIDVATNKQIAATYKITTLQTNETVVIEGLGAADKYNITEPAMLQIEASAKGYKTFSGQLNATQLGAGKTFNFEARLEKAGGGEYTIVIVDLDQRSIVPNPTVVVKDSKGRTVRVVRKAESNDWLVTLAGSDEKYTIEVTAPDYLPYNAPVSLSKSGVINVGMTRIPTPEVAIRAVDALTKQPVAANFKLIGTETELSGASSVAVPYKAKLRNMTYDMAVTAPEYRPHQEKFVQTDNAPKERVVELYRLAYTLVFQAVDAQTKKLIPTATLKIIDQKTNQTTNANGETKPVAFAADGAFRIEVAAANYEPQQVELQPFEWLSKNANRNADGVIAFLPKTFAINLAPIASTTLVMKATDRDAGTPIEATITVTEQRTGKITTLKVTPQQPEQRMTFLANETLTINVSAAQYRPVNQVINIDISKPNFLFEARLGLIPPPPVVVLKEVTITAIDALTKQPVGATFKLIGTETELNGTSTTAAGYKAKLANMTYDLAATAPNYRPYQEKYAQTDASPAGRVVELYRLTYPLAFQAIDAKTKKPVPTAVIRLVDLKTNQTTNFTGETKQLELPADGNYTLEATNAGYEPMKLNLQPLEWLTQNATKNAKGEITSLPKLFALNLTPLPPVVVVKPVAPPKKSDIFEDLKVGQAITLDNVYFDQSAYTLRPESYAQLDKLATTMIRNPKLKVEIGGHTDNVGDARLNLALSENRAKVISTYLVNKNKIAENRLSYRGYGQTKPVAENNSEENKKKNRRVEFTVIEN